ncbi:hypothetical protein COCON_G00211690 [Conger conger]|uniref:G-protein coupled receptors family 2 profile 1 domain-containing protein n=1 Tax=Conger conger TaxID=82655 RepID=A0A9Q1HQ20_CONCO|nr:hypothetical protein COCON_G00211690 [Conger conger]
MPAELTEAPAHSCRLGAGPGLSRFLPAFSGNAPRVSRPDPVRGSRVTVYGCAEMLWHVAHGAIVRAGLSTLHPRPAAAVSCSTRSLTDARFMPFPGNRAGLSACGAPIRSGSAAHEPSLSPRAHRTDRATPPLTPRPCLVLTLWIVCVSGAGAELTCDTLILLSGNFTLRSLVAWNLTLAPSNITGVFCNMSIDGIGTCWPRSRAGELVTRPCPEFFYGVRYNTTSKPPRPLRLATVV